MNQISYRPEIDGLKAIAVVSIVGYHADFPGLSGGFVGVDVFFVVSGYLISSLLFREFENTGRISSSIFYERRAALNIQQSTSVFALGTKYFGTIDYSALKYSSIEDLDETRIQRSADTTTISEILTKQQGAFIYIDIMSLVCEDAQNCRQFTPEGHPIGYDKRHLTPEGASFLGGLLFASSPLSAYKSSGE